MLKSPHRGTKEVGGGGGVRPPPGSAHVFISQCYHIPVHVPYTCTCLFYGIVQYLLFSSALDAESEHLVQEALERVMVGRTVVTIAHRLSTIRKADSIAVLYKGHITELGTYDKLMTITDGHFRRLVERQTIGGQGEDGEVQPTKRPEDIIKDV